MDEYHIDSYIGNTYTIWVCSGNTLTILTSIIFIFSIQVLAKAIIRYQLPRQHQYTGDIRTSTYNQITNSNVPTIKYTRNDKEIFAVDEMVFDNFIYNPNIIKTSVTINVKNTSSTVFKV